MRYFWLLLIISCTPATPPVLQKGDCVIGPGMDIYQLMRESEGVFLFARVPVQEGSPLEIVKDISTFKKVECPH